MSTALKNAIKRKTHKERAQPAARRQYGLLEKKKDYLLRAKDFHKKEETIKTLRLKAEERNPDEFYFGMENAQTRDGVHLQRSTEANKYSQEELRLMKTQDMGYLASKAQTEAKKVERMQQSLHLLGAPASNTHTVFVDDEESAEKFDPAAYFDTPAELLDRSFNRPRSQQLTDPRAVSAGADAAVVVARMERKKRVAYKELLQRQERQQKLASMVQHTAFEKELMGKGRKRKLRPEEANTQQRGFQWVWKQERKK